MNRRHAIASLIGLCLTPAARASTREVAYESPGDTPVRLTLRIQDSEVEGVLEEGGVQLAVRGSLAGDRLQGSLREPLTGLRLGRVSGQLRGDDLDFAVRPSGGGEPSRLAMRRVGAPATSPAAPAAAAAAAAAGTIDHALVGRWRWESQLNSAGGAGGFASFSTVRILALDADGRVRQWVRSSGGGATWSHGSGEQLEFSGRWQARGGELLVQPDGHPGFVGAGRYRFVGERLVTENGQGRQIWQR